MAKLTKKDVLHVANLAKLTLTPKEIAKFQEQLSKIVDYISQLSEVDTSNYEPTTQTTGLESIFREDKINTLNQLTSEEALSGTEAVKNDYFVVKQVINKNE